jgi:hypothetical protein
LDSLRIGRIIENERKRDAVHMAVVPVVAGQALSPGEHVGMVDGLAVVKASAKPLGIVDPFLRRTVDKGERFWMFLYPGTITSLRHEWEHPAFGGGGNIPVSSSETWIREYADELGLNYQTLMDGAKAWIEDEEYLCEGPLLEGVYVRDGFWDHYEKVTGTKVKSSQRESFFSCSC